MPSHEFQKICRDLSVLGETCTIACTKEGVKFSVTGDLGTGNITHRQNVSSDKVGCDTNVMCLAHAPAAA